MAKVRKAEKEAANSVEDAKVQAAQMVDDAKRQADAVREAARAEASDKAKAAFSKAVEEEAVKAAEYDRQLDSLILQQKEEAKGKKNEVISSVIASVV